MSVPGVINYHERRPAGSAPSHSAITSDDAVVPELFVIDVGRLPVDWENMCGKLHVAPLHLATYVVPVRYDPATRQWETTIHQIDDFMPSMLRVYIDVEADLPEKHPNAEYVLLLGGCLVGEVTLLCLQAVCILARRMSEQHEELLQLARYFRKQVVEGKIKSNKPLQDKYWPDRSNSYERIGLVRGAGSVDAWNKTGIKLEPAFLF